MNEIRAEIEHVLFLPMVLLERYALPLPRNVPPEGHVYDRDITGEDGNVAAFVSGINERDRFLGTPKCLVCGQGGLEILEDCHIHNPHERDMVRPDPSCRGPMS